jgi:hypothetical protein
MEYALLAVLGVYMYASTSSLPNAAKKELLKPPEPITEDMQHYGGEANINRFNDKYKRTLCRHIGQFGVPELLKYDQDGCTTRTWDISQDLF